MERKVSIVKNVEELDSFFSDFNFEYFNEYDHKVENGKLSYIPRDGHNGVITLYPDDKGLLKVDASFNVRKHLPEFIEYISNKCGFPPIFKCEHGDMNPEKKASYKYFAVFSPLEYREEDTARFFEGFSGTVHNIHTFFFFFSEEELYSYIVKLMRTKILFGKPEEKIRADIDNGAIFNFLDYDISPAYYDTMLTLAKFHTSKFCDTLRVEDGQTIVDDSKFDRWMCKCSSGHFGTEGNPNWATEYTANQRPKPGKVLAIKIVDGKSQYDLLKGTPSYN